MFEQLKSLIENKNLAEFSKLLQQNILATDLTKLLLFALKSNHLDFAQVLCDHIEPISLSQATANLTIHNTNPNLNPYPIFANDTETLLKLMDLYLVENTLGTWTIKDRNGTSIFYPNRDQVLGQTAPHAQSLWQQHELKLQTVLRAIRALAPWLNSSNIKYWYNQKIQERQRYFSADISDDSDSDDESAFNRGDTDERTSRHRHISSKFAPEFWQQTRRTTDREAGLIDKIKKVLTFNEKTISELQNEIKKKLQERATLPSTSNAQFAKKFVAHFRGINYMADRWSTTARRYHYYTNEVGQPQFSETVLKELPFDFYRELGQNHDFLTDPKLLSLLNRVAQQLDESYQSLSYSAHVGNTLRPKKEPYFFSSVRDYLQHQFSNGISEHLLILKQWRVQSPEFRRHFPNAFNYAIAAGDRPYHSLKYALGLKEYYANDFALHYNADGSLQNSHAGKIYIILQEVEEFLRNPSINRVMHMCYAGRAPIDPMVVSELETSFISAIPGHNVVYQLPIKFPSFHKSYKKVYEVKYGMDAELYMYFQHMIRKTQPETPLRNAVITLLKEWLCAYFEALLLRIAQDEANKKGGVLTYVNHDNSLTDIPEQRPYSPGNENVPTRNLVHTVENVRWWLGSCFKEKTPTAVEITNYLNWLCSLQNSPDWNILDTISHIIAIAEPSPTRNLITFGQPSETQYKRDQAIRIIQANRHLFSVPNPQSPHIIIRRDISNLCNSAHLYTNIEINILLKQSLSAHTNVAICNAQHPLLQGAIQAFAQTSFFEVLTQALTSQLITVIPINATRERIPAKGHIPIAGIYWVGIVIKPQGNGYLVEYMDPINDPTNAKAIYELILHVANKKNVKIDFKWYTAQQAYEFDCGPWTVDSLIQLSKQQFVMKTQQTAQQLRQNHNEIYQQALNNYQQLASAVAPTTSSQTATSTTTVTSSNTPSVSTNFFATPTQAKTQETHTEALPHEHQQKIAENNDKAPSHRL